MDGFTGDVMSHNMVLGPHISKIEKLTTWCIQEHNSVFIKDKNGRDFKCHTWKIMGSLPLSQVKRLLDTGRLFEAHPS